MSVEITGELKNYEFVVCPFSFPQFFDSFGLDERAAAQTVQDPEGDQRLSRKAPKSVPSRSVLFISLAIFQFSCSLQAGLASLRAS